MILDRSCVSGCRLPKEQEASHDKKRLVSTLLGKEGKWSGPEAEEVYGPLEALPSSGADLESTRSQADRFGSAQVPVGAVSCQRRFPRLERSRRFYRASPIGFGHCP